jgi:hypothetical protein
MTPPAAPAEYRIVPFDHQVSFELTDRRDNVLTKFINVSVEGHFIATAIGYGLQSVSPIFFAPQISPGPPGGPPSRLVPLQGVTISQLLDGFEFALSAAGAAKGNVEAQQQQMLKSGAQFNPEFTDLIISHGRGGFFVDSLGDSITRLFQTSICAPEQVHFLYRIIDNASSRELQSEPVHNLAGWGRANGDRPFRFFPRPLVFEPRAVIRFQITEITGQGRLYIVLQGYKVLRTSPLVRE